MTAVATPDAARLVFAAVAGLILLLILIIKFKVHAMISILIGAVGIGLMAGMPLSDIIGSVNEGIGNTLKGIALLVGLGSMPCPASANSARCIWPASPLPSPAAPPCAPTSTTPASGW